jgi:hypothetical protein
MFPDVRGSIPRPRLSTATQEVHMEREWITIQELEKRLGTTQAIINKTGKGGLIKGHVIHQKDGLYAYDAPELVDDDPIDFEFVDLPTKKVKIDGGDHALGRLSVAQLNRIAKDLFVGSSKDRFQLMSRIRECGPSGECRHCDAPRAHVIKDSTDCAFCLRDRAIDYKHRYTGKMWEQEGVKYPIDPFEIPSTECAALLDAGVSSTGELLEFLLEANTIIEALDALNGIKGIGPVGARRILDWAKSQGWKEDVKFKIEDVQVFVAGVEVKGSVGLDSHAGEPEEPQVDLISDWNTEPGEMSGELGDDWSDVSGNPVEKEWTKEHIETAKRLSLATFQTESELIDSILETHERATEAAVVFDGYCHAVSTADKDEDGSWEAARLLGVGSSDSPIILGASRFMTVEELYNVKLGHPVDNKPWLDVYRHFGTWFEVYVRDEIRRQWYPDLVDGKAIGILVSDVYPWMCANIDAFSPSEKKLTEVKTRSKTKLEHADRIQVHHQMAVTGLEKAEVVIVVPPMDRKLLMGMKEHLSCSPQELGEWILAHSEIVRHNVDCDEELLAAVVDGSCKFWDSVQAGITPEQEKCEELEASGDLAEAFVLFDLGEIDREEFLSQVEAAITSPYIVRVRCDGHLVSRTQKGAWVIKMKTEEVEI